MYLSKEQIAELPEDVQTQIKEAHEYYDTVYVEWRMGEYRVSCGGIGIAGPTKNPWRLIGISDLKKNTKNTKR